MKYHWCSTVKNIAIKGRASIDLIDFESWLLLKSASWVKLHPCSSWGSHWTHQTNSVVQQSCHFSRKLVYGLIVTAYHTAVTVIADALFTTGKKKKKCVKKASISVEYLQLCKTLCLEYRCLYISSAVLGVACSHDCICRQPKWISTISAPV